MVKPRNAYSGIFKYKLLNTGNAQILTLRIKHPEHNAFVEEFDHAEFGPKGSQMVRFHQSFSKTLNETCLTQNKNE